MAKKAPDAHYFSNGLGEGSRIKAGERVPTIAWGTLSLTNLTTGGKVSCHNMIGAVEENPEPGGAAGPAAQGETQSFDPYECESEACTAAATGGGPATYISVFAEGSEAPSSETGTGTMTSPNTGTTLPTEEPLVASGDDLKWKNHLLSEGTTIRQETEEAKVNVICHMMTGVNAKGEPEYGAQVPEVSKGTTSPRRSPSAARKASRLNSNSTRAPARSKTKKAKRQDRRQTEDHRLQRPGTHQRQSRGKVGALARNRRASLNSGQTRGLPSHHFRSLVLLLTRPRPRKHGA